MEDPVRRVAELSTPLAPAGVQPLICIRSPSPASLSIGMRLVATAFLLVAGLAPASIHAEDFAWPGHGTVRVDVPTGWSVRAQPANEVGFHLNAQPLAGPAVSAQFSLIVSPSEHPLEVDQVKGRLDDLTRQFLDGSVEKAVDPQPLALPHGSG